MHRLPWVIVLVALAGVVAQTCNLQRADSRADKAAARADSVEAANDTTRFVVAIGAIRTLYGDSVRAVERRAVQIAPRLDALDRALQRITVANATLLARVSALQTTVLGTVLVDSSDTRRASFVVDTTPYRGTAEVALPPQGAGSLVLDLRVDPVRLRTRVQCGETTATGFRPATLVVSGPEWLRVQVDSTQQSPDVCNPPPRRRWFDGRLSIGPSANLTCFPGGACRAGFGGSAQISAFRWP